MIIVRNTKELQEHYDLNQIPDDELIRVVGGLEGKDKYNLETYERRTTYPARQLKQIIYLMQEIESKIPEHWDESQKAKYIYNTLGENIEYNYDKETYKNQQSSNLTILLSKKGICAGYALLFKEMMDRQGIQCDYIRGEAKTGRGKTEKHAWNVLTINGKTIPVDLTWDSAKIRRGEKGLRHFGNDRDFFIEHEEDTDERRYNYSLLKDDEVEAIDISTRKKREMDKDKKISALEIAIEQTYRKYVSVNGGQNQVKYAIKNYILKNNPKGFTRHDRARDGIEELLSKEDMLDIIIEAYVYRSREISDTETDVLRVAVNKTIEKYNPEQAKYALKKYILKENSEGFTRSNNARSNVEKYIKGKDEALDIIISEFVSYEIEDIRRAMAFENENIAIIEKNYFNASEFSEIALPKEKTNIIQKAIKWIKERMPKHKERTEESKIETKEKNNMER